MLIPGNPDSNRRPLQFDALENVVEEAELLLCDGYRRVGNWSLGRICDHLSNAFNYSRDGFPAMKPWLIRKMARTLFLRRILARKLIHLRLPAPIPTAYDGTDEEGVRRLAAGIEQFKKPDGKFADHTILGTLNCDQWLQFHLWHSEHHFSFLIPFKDG